MKFTEGPVWLPKEQKLIFSDIPNSVLMQWSQKAGLSEFRKSENANGNILDLDGNIISCQHGARNIIRIDNKGKIFRSGRQVQREAVQFSQRCGGVEGWNPLVYGSTLGLA
jgi:sugar lactone lactonase YvrE